MPVGCQALSKVLGTEHDSGPKEHTACRDADTGTSQRLNSINSITETRSWHFGDTRSDMGVEKEGCLVVPSLSHATDLLQISLTMIQQGKLDYSNLIGKKTEAHQGTFSAQA